MIITVLATSNEQPPSSAPFGIHFLNERPQVLLLFIERNYSQLSISQTLRGPEKIRDIESSR